jgi:hypothetical protein
MKPSNSEYACRVTLPVKKDGNIRFCGDYRPLNLQTRRDSFPMPLVEDVISQLGKSTWFTALDLQSGFWQIRMAPEDEKKTALITKIGLYDWTVMPFGLKNATSTFTRTMSLVFKELGSEFLKVFVDDLNVHSKNWEDHLRHLDAVFAKLREVNLKLNPGKCCFGARSIAFLGHVVSHEGTRPDPSKIDAVTQFPVPRTVSDVRSFLGLTGYYRNYVKGYARIAVPLFELTKKEVAFVWDLGCQDSFDALKRALVSAPVLIRPDFEKQFCLDVDWSTKGVGAILSQREGRSEKVVAYASKGLTSAQKKFHPMEGECYAFIWGVMHFRQYLHRTHFILRTDHKPLEWLATVSDAHGRRGRWIDMLQDFSFKILHRPGMRHTNVDALSRNPVGAAVDDEDFGCEIQDLSIHKPEGPSEVGRGLFATQRGKESEWLGLRRRSRGLKQHFECCFGINHWRRLGEHQIYMLEVLTETSLDEGDDSLDDRDEIIREEIQISESSRNKLVVEKGKTRYYDKKQQLDIILAAQELWETDGHEADGVQFGGDTECVDDLSKADIWEDAICMSWLKEGCMVEDVDQQESKRIRKRAKQYSWRDNNLYFKGLYVPRPEERVKLVTQMHKNLGHFGEQRTLAEICQRHFWSNRTECVKTVVRSC